MTCQEASDLMSAFRDGELAEPEMQRLSAHLSACAACRAEQAALADQHAHLVRAFAPGRQKAARVADRVIEQLPIPDPSRHAAQENHPRARTQSDRSGWRHPAARLITAVAAAAAGFLLAVALLSRHPHVPTRLAIQPSATQRVPTNARPTQPIATLALATGRVELRADDHQAWRDLSPGGSVLAGQVIRTTPNARCEFHVIGGSELRLDENTEVRFASAHAVRLISGRLWSGSSDGHSLLVWAPTAAFLCPNGAFALSCNRQDAQLVVIDGTARVRPAAAGAASQEVLPSATAADGQRVVHAGQLLQIEHGSLGGPRNLESVVQATQWLNDILALKGRDNPELAGRIDELLARIGDLKMSQFYENEIRLLGDRCVPPLTRYIQSERSAHDPQRRRVAARLIRDLAQPWCVPYLIELLQDADAEVRASAADGLARLTGQNMGLPAAAWRSRPQSDRDAAVAQWRRWWDGAKAYVPGAISPRGDAPAPMDSSPPINEPTIEKQKV